MAGRIRGPRQRGAWVAISLLALVVAGCRKAPEPLRHLILVTVDTWRADHFSTEQAQSAITPKLAELSAESVRFAQASSVGDETLPGVAGVLSGVIPHRSGMISNGYLVVPELPTLATVLRDASFETRALVANPLLGPGSGFEHGFDSYRLLNPLEGQTKARAPGVTDAALEVVREWVAWPAWSTGRLFLWVHYLDPHGPYRPPAEDRALFPVEALGELREIDLLPEEDHSGWGGVPAYQQQGLDPVPRDVRDYLSRYTAELHSLDRELGP